MSRAAVLDLGSNSFHVLVADLEGRQLTPVLREREMLHLGRAVARTGGVPTDAAEDARATAGHLAGLARRAGATRTIAVATAALREATNGRQVLAALREAIGEPVRVLDGTEEARLAYLGVRAAVAVDREPVLVLDLGGGSLELAAGVGADVEHAVSLPLGASRLSAALTADPPTSRDLADLTRRIDRELVGAVVPLRAAGWGAAVAVGGTVRALARVVAAQDGTWLPASLNEYRLDAHRLGLLTAELLATPYDARRDLPGMKSRRADHLHVAGLVLSRALAHLGLDDITVSDWGLREGVLLEAHGHRVVPDAVTLRGDEVRRLRHAFVPDDPHPLHVRELAGQLFDGVGDPQLGDDDRELLAHAAELHAIGEGVALRRQHLHGAYLVQHAEMRGFSPRQTALLTSLVRFHRSRGVDTSYPAYASLAPADRDRCTRLLALLQLADTLDRAHDQAVDSVDVTVEGDRMTLRLTGGGLHVTDVELARRTALAVQVFDREIVVDDRGGAA